MDNDKSDLERSTSVRAGEAPTTNKTPREKTPQEDTGTEVRSTALADHRFFLTTFFQRPNTHYKPPRIHFLLDDRSPLILRASTPKPPKKFNTESSTSTEIHCSSESSPYGKAAP